ncbi:hypothetical protein HMPREF1152_0235 [Mogibacterium sp. CM50]|uniref:Uncharacterized protein n=1 Tax=Mogibacterium timidum ATCC 33093 TaxID=1401079 RepID=X8IQN1_9FIRM|nr:hypothetical protein HMPREF1152_0235 [Mogibacterium sp. CM50]EUC52100.1 hypothetical protein HMPREF0581_0291 [Mogibacterium timidum ATCC 33093]
MPNNKQMKFFDNTIKCVGGKIKFRIEFLNAADEIRWNFAINPGRSRILCVTCPG